MLLVGMVLCGARVVRAGPLAWQVTVAGRDHSCLRTPGRPRESSRRESIAPGRARRASGFSHAHRAGMKRRSSGAGPNERGLGSWASPNEALQLTGADMRPFVAPVELSTKSFGNRTFLALQLNATR